MSADYLFAVGTIGLSTRCGRKPRTLIGAARHNRRAIQAELGACSRIDPARIALNETIFGPGSPEGVVALAVALAAEAGIDVAKLRNDYTQAVELLFSLPAESVIDAGQYFRRCVEWVGERFGVGNILSADIHKDEATPHCHVLVSPLVDRKMRGSVLVSRPETAKMTELFYRDVAQQFGLQRPAAALSGIARSMAVCDVLAVLESTRDAVLRSALWPSFKRDIERSPAKYMEMLGITARQPAPKSMRTMAQIFTSKGKGAMTESKAKGKPIGFASAYDKPIGFESNSEKDRNLSCVGFDIPALPIKDQHAKQEPTLDDVAPQDIGAVRKTPSRQEIAHAAMSAALHGNRNSDRNLTATKTVADDLNDTATALVADGDGITRVHDPDFDVSVWSEWM